MYHFFSNEVSMAENRIRLSGGDARHVSRVLRLRENDRITVSSGDGREYLCRIEEITADEVVLAIEDISGNASELPVRITLYQGFPKGDKLELIIQKAVELGADRIVPVWMERSVVKMDSQKAAKRRERYQAISEAAAKQSGRGRVPEVGTFLSMPEAVRDAEGLDRILLPYEDAKGLENSRRVLRELRDDAEKGKVRRVGIFIGPEGGFSGDEVKALSESGASVITLGNRILRTETAGMAILSVLGFMLDRDGE